MKNIWKSLFVSPSVLVATLILSAASVAAETLTISENTQEEALGQVTSVSQFSDVQPTDWAFQALQSLVERYGCIAGYPNSTFRGNRALTRFEFAAGLNACLDRMNELIAVATSNVGTGDLSTIKRLQSEFSSELATLRGRVDALEARTAQLE
ncbi:MAG: iron uptake porin, partial [Cyanobacteria bacterium J06628_3]